MMKRSILSVVAMLVLLVGCDRTTAVPESSVTLPAAGDGGKVAYVQYGDVWVKPLPGGEAVQLTDDGLNAYPLWSPSGRYLAYRKDVELMTIDVTTGFVHSWGSPVSEAVWSPVDDRLAYVSGSGILRLTVANADDGSEVALIPPEVGVLGRVGRIAWSPDGQTVVYEWSEGDSQGLYLMPSGGGAAAELYASGKPERGDALVAGWTGDGRNVLFWQGPIVSASQLADGVPLYAVPVEGGAPSVVADEVLYYDGFVVPRRNGSDVALVEGTGRGVWTRKQLVVADVAGGEATTLSAPGQAVIAPAWSPDGTQIAYVGMPDEGDLVGGNTAREGLMERRVWLGSVDGGEPTQLTDDSAYRDERPFWSADGKSLLFVRMDANDAVSLWWLDVASREATQVVDGIGPLPGPTGPWFGIYGYIGWSPVLDWWAGDVMP